MKNKKVAELEKKADEFAARAHAFAGRTTRPHSKPSTCVMAKSNKMMK